MDQLEPILMEPTPLDYSATWGFVLRVAGRMIRPDTVPAVNTAYADWVLSGRIAINDGWSAYVFAMPVPAPAGYAAFQFVDTLPTTPVVTERIDPIWGVVQDHKYLDLTSAPLPDVAATGLTEFGATRYVLDAQEVPQSGGCSIVTVTTVPTNTLTLQEDDVDAETGIKYTITKVYTLTASKPGTAESVNAAGNFTTVARVSHNLYLATTRPATLMPTSEASALEWDTLDALMWPDVLEHYEFFQVVDSTLNKATDLLATKIRDGFAGDVRVTKRLWWQSTPYTITVPEQMQPAGIQVDGNLKNFTIRPTLHGAFVYTEQNFVFSGGDGNGFGGIEFSFGPTTFTDWPATVTKTRQTYRDGGYLIEQSIYHRPANHLDSASELSVSLVSNPSPLPYYDL